MQLEITETNSALSPRLFIFNVRWGAIFAGLAVGLATNMVLMLIGTSAGLSLFNIGEAGTTSNLPMAASIWNTVSMIVSAFVGGYVAARGSGFKRTSDGILHAAVAWGMTIVLAIFFASAATGATFNAMFPSLQGSPGHDTGQIIGNIGHGDREAAAQNLQRDLGISSSQAHTLVDQALALGGNDQATTPEARDSAQSMVRTAAVVSIWLTLSTILSLLASLGGGMAGVRGARRVLHRRVTNIA